MIFTEFINHILLTYATSRNIQKQFSKNAASAALFEGFRAVTNIFRSIVDELKPGEEYYVIGATYGDVPGLREFFQAHHQRRAKKGVIVKMLANAKTRGNLMKNTYLNAEVRFLPEYLMSNMEVVFYKNKVFIILSTTTMLGFFVESEEAANGFKTYFNTFWKIAEK